MLHRGGQGRWRLKWICNTGELARQRLSGAQGLHRTTTAFSQCDRMWFFMVALLVCHASSFQTLQCLPSRFYIFHSTRRSDSVNRWVSCRSLSCGDRLHLISVLYSYTYISHILLIDHG